LEGEEQRVCTYDVYPDAMGGGGGIPLIKSALNFSTTYAEEREAEEKRMEVIMKEDGYDSIMMVHKSEACLVTVSMVVRTIERNRK